MSTSRISRTLTYLRADLEVDRDAISAIHLFSSGAFPPHERLLDFDGRLAFATECEEVELTGESLRVRFGPEQPTIVPFEANIDLDAAGRLLGIELLLDGPAAGLLGKRYVRRFLARR